MADPKRCVVFLDYQNVHFTGRQRFLGRDAAAHEGHIRPRRLAELLVSRRDEPSVLTDVRVNRGRPDPRRQPGAAAANDRQAERWEQAGVDVALASDFVAMGVTRKYDVGVLFSRDSDLTPALEQVRRREAARVEVARWNRRSGLRFTDPDLGSLWCHYLTEDDFEQLRDRTDYTRPPAGGGTGQRARLDHAAREVRDRAAGLEPPDDGAKRRMDHREPTHDL